MISWEQLRIWKIGGIMADTVNLQVKQLQAVVALHVLLLAVVSVQCGRVHQPQSALSAHDIEVLASAKPSPSKDLGASFSTPQKNDSAPDSPHKRFLKNSNGVDELGSTRNTLNKGAAPGCVDYSCVFEALAPAGEDVTSHCSNALCLVEALLEKKVLIHIDSHIDVSGAAPLPEISTKVAIVGRCSGGISCQIDAQGGSEIFIVESTGYLILREVEVTGALCSEGSAVMVLGSGSELVGTGGRLLTLNVKFSNNSATGSGGAVTIEAGGSGFFRETIFERNSAARGGSVFIGSREVSTQNGTRRGSGDLVCGLGSCATFINTEFSDSNAQFGGAVYVDDSSKTCDDDGGAKIDCSYCVFRNNSAAEDGGAVFLNYRSSGAIGNFKQSSFLENSAGGYGGDIAMKAGEALTRGAQLYAYEVQFSESVAQNGSFSTAVRPFSTSTFTKCDFTSYTEGQGSAVSCEGSCNNFCPITAMQADEKVARVAMQVSYTEDSCPQPPAPLCSWVALECVAATPPSSNSPSPSSPAILPPAFLPPRPAPPSPFLLPPASSPPTIIPPSPLLPPISITPSSAPPTANFPSPPSPARTPASSAPPTIIINSPPPATDLAPPPVPGSWASSPPPGWTPPLPPATNLAPPPATTPAISRRPPTATPPFSPPIGLSPPVTPSATPPSSSVPILAPTHSPRVRSPTPLLTPPLSPTPAQISPPPPQARIANHQPPPPKHRSSSSPKRRRHPPPPIGWNYPPPSSEKSSKPPPPSGDGSVESAPPAPPSPTGSSTNHSTPSPSPHAPSSSPLKRSPPALPSHHVFAPSSPPTPEKNNNPPPTSGGHNSELRSTPPAQTDKHKKPPPTPDGGGSVESAPPAPPPPPSSSPSAPYHPHRHHHNGTSITGDPHFIGKHGERFDFHGKDGNDYCVVSDKKIHINMHVFRGTHIKSTFISKIGILYLEDKILIETQARKSAHGTENQWRVLINNVELPENQNVARDSGLFVSRFAQSVHIKVAGDMDINATVVAATFGKRGSGANYINFKILQLKVSPSIHGILGQTYQETVRAYQKLHAAKGKKRSRAAAVLVDGLDKDYVTSDILAPNCKFGVFEEQTRGFSRLVRRVVLERAQSLFTKSSKDEIVCDCTGFGDHNLCLTSQG